MKKQTIILSVFLVFLLLGMITLFQLIRMEKMHLWLAPKTSPQVQVKTMTASGAQQEGQSLMVYLHKDDSELSSLAIENVEKTLDYAKVPHQSISIEEIKQLEPSPYSILVLSGEHTNKWPKPAITKFVEEGGRLMIAGRFVDRTWNDLVGIASLGDFVDDIYGIEFEQEVFPGYTNLMPEDSQLNHSMAEVEVKPESSVYLTAEDEPLMWVHPYGQGKVLFWNSTIVVDKAVRGLILQSISFLPPEFVSTQAAIKVLHIDDFPSPVPYETSESIKQQYDLSIKDFYKEIWWQDMLKIADQYNFALTGYMIGTYRDDTKIRGEELIERSKFPMLYFGRSLLRYDGEIGLHGYNHQSMVTADEPTNPDLGYREWESQEAMESSIAEAASLFSYYFPDEDLTSYVPPSNIINRTGIAALAETLPDLQTIASLYLAGDEASLEQEYEFDEEYEDIYHFPRITSGYLETKFDKFSQTDAIAHLGVFAHFLHPDDVLDTYRSNGQTWETMKSHLVDMGEHIQTNYSYLEPLTQSNATKKMIQYQESEIEVDYQKDQIVIDGTGVVNPSTIFVRVEEGKALETGTFDFGEVEEYGHHLYLVTMTEPEAKLQVKEVTE
ncbi:DUF2194 domain-containing protein [Halobacillus salinus]|uniref:DUF2194 domain-containing protein n=1 Tax=Halobacillus salinus TaxID=192814 RepID=UPI0009A722E7|nr:DUF2194 domain-containing protein [Halobacillus salinus]